MKSQIPYCSKHAYYCEECRHVFVWLSPISRHHHPVKFINTFSADKSDKEITTYVLEQIETFGMVQHEPYL